MFVNIKRKLYIPVFSKHKTYERTRGLYTIHLSEYMFNPTHIQYIDL